MSDNTSSLKDVVAKYLRRHPTFLDDYPDVLEILQLNHAAGVASSLIERQVNQLRKKNHELTRQLNRLMHVASENEQLMSRLHQLTLELMSIGDPTEFFQHLGRSLLDDFKADILRNQGRVEERVNVFLPGGHLVIKWLGSGTRVRMKGPAHHTYTGTLSHE